MGDNGEIFARLTRIEQTLARIDERTQAATTSHADHESRIRAIEAKLQRQGGWMAGAAAVAVVLFQALVWALKHIFGGGS